MQAGRQAFNITCKIKGLTPCGATNSRAVILVPSLLTMAMAIPLLALSKAKPQYTLITARSG